MGEVGASQGFVKLVCTFGRRVRAGKTVNEGVIGRGDVAEFGDVVAGGDLIGPPMVMVTAKGGEMVFGGLRTRIAAETAAFSASVCLVMPPS